MYQIFHFSSICTNLRALTSIINANVVKTFLNKSIYWIYQIIQHTVLLKILFRIRLGYTQYDVGILTGKYLGTFLSQTTVSRFESLNLSYRNMLKLRFILEKWMMVRISVTKYNYKPLKPLDCSQMVNRMKLAIE